MKIHMVKKGDSLYAIAQKYNVSLEELLQANPEITNPDVVEVGMKVKVPMPAVPTYEVMHQHKVQQGDTLWKLSKACARSTERRLSLTVPPWWRDGFFAVWMSFAHLLHRMLWIV